jgi:hypothetical protein
MLKNNQADDAQPLPDSFSTNIHYGTMACSPQIAKD